MKEGQPRGPHPTIHPLNGEAAEDRQTAGHVPNPITSASPTTSIDAKADYTGQSSSGWKRSAAPTTTPSIACPDCTIGVLSTSAKAFLWTVSVI